VADERQVIGGAKAVRRERPRARGCGNRAYGPDPRDSKKLPGGLRIGPAAGNKLMRGQWRPTRPAASGEAARASHSRGRRETTGAARPPARRGAPQVVGQEAAAGVMDLPEGWYALSLESE